MIEIRAVSDGVGPIERIVPRVERRRERSHRETPFPPLPGEEEQEEPVTDDESPPPEEKEEKPEGGVDIHVLGLILPTRQLLPPAPHPRTLH